MTVSIPKMQSIGNVFILAWDIEGIGIKIDRLNERSDGVTGEALVTKGKGHLYHARVNLLSPHSKQAMINALDKRLNTIDWATIIEQAFTKVLIEYRKGEPAVKLGTLPPRTQTRYRLYPFILEGERTVFYGYGGTGKSKLAQFMALLVQSGIPLLGMNPVKGNVLILDWETSSHTVDEWINATKQGMGIETDEMPLYRYCTRGLADDIVEVQKIVLEHNIQLVIVDSVGMAIGGDAESQDMTRQYFGALRSLRVSSVSIDHKAKKGKGIYGSIYKTNIARSTFEIRSQQTAGSNYMDIGIYHRKANDTALIKPIGFHIEFTGDIDYTESVLISKQNVTDVPELEEGLSYRQRVIHLLKDGAMEVKDIALAIGTTEAITRTTLNRFKKTFVKTDKGWGLLSSYED